MVNCNSQKNNTQNIKKPFFQREWMMTSFNGFTKEELMESGAKIDLTNKEGNNYSASMGCNNLNFVAEINDKGTMKISDIMATMMFCEGKMKLEQAFLSTFPKMNSYKIEGHVLTLSDGKGNSMKFVAADWD